MTRQEGVEEEEAEADDDRGKKNYLYRTLQSTKSARRNANVTRKVRLFHFTVDGQSKAELEGKA